MNFRLLAKRDPSSRYFLKQCRLKEHLIFITYEGKVEGVIERITKYHLKVKGRRKLLEKLNILFLCKPEASEAVGCVLTIDHEVLGKQLEPPIKKTERLEILDDVLQRCFEEKRQIEVMLRNGYVLRGSIYSYGIFSIRLALDKDSRVVIMRPNIYALDSEVKGKLSPG